MSHWLTFNVLAYYGGTCIYPDSKVQWANMGPTWVLSAPGGPHVGPMNLAIRVSIGVSYHNPHLCGADSWDASSWKSIERFRNPTITDTIGLVKGSDVINYCVDVLSLRFTNCLNISAQNSHLGRPLRVCHVRLIKSRKYCSNLDLIWISWCNNSVTFHSIMFKD